MTTNGTPTCLLDTLLDRWDVGQVDEHHREENPDRSPPVGWWWVCEDSGVIAYFSREKDAFRFRLAEINRHLNG